MSNAAVESFPVIRFNPIVRNSLVYSCHGSSCGKECGNCIYTRYCSPEFAANPKLSQLDVLRFLIGLLEPCSFAGYSALLES